MKAALTNIGNNLPSAGSTKVEMSEDAFKRWMKKLRYETDSKNAHQVVSFIVKLTTLKVGGIQYTPNWHITAMTIFRSGGNVRNFHFKVEMAKAASHYWHYVIHKTATGFEWVGDPNPKIPATNQGGGGAGANAVKLAENYTSTEAAARSHGLDGKVTKSTQEYMLRVLNGMVKSKEIKYEAGQLSI